MCGPERSSSRAMAAVWVGAALLVGWGNALAAESKREMLVGRKMPRLQFHGARGQRVSVPDMQGQVVLVDFWATWCGPCRRELPTLLELHGEYGEKGFAVVGVSLDKEKAELLEFLDAEKIPWPKYFDGQGWKNRQAQRFDVHSIPASILIDQKGIVRAVDLRGAAVRREVERLLGVEPADRREREGDADQAGDRAERPPRSVPVAWYPFDEDARDALGRSSAFALRNAAVADGALYVSGRYERPQRDTGHALTADMARMDYDVVTIALDFAALGFEYGENRRDNLICAGTSAYWLTLQRSGQGRLEVLLNGRQWRHEFPVKIQPNTWYRLVCHLDVPAGEITARVNGKTFEPAKLPEGFQLDVSAAGRRSLDKCISFTNYSTRSTFWGFADNLRVYNGPLTESDLAQIDSRPLRSELPPVPSEETPGK